MSSRINPSPPVRKTTTEQRDRKRWETFYARTLSHISSKPSSDPRPARPEAHPSDAPSDEESVDDDDDPGTSWFSEHNAPDKVLRFLTDASFPLAPCNRPQPAPSVLDLGTGNGSMLALLRTRGGFAGPMVGVDYSARSVELARELQRSKMHSAYAPDSDDDDDDEPGPAAAGAAEEIRFEEWDILAGTDALSAEEVRDAAKTRLDWFPYAAGRGLISCWIRARLMRSRCRRRPGKGTGACASGTLGLCGGLFGREGLLLLRAVIGRRRSLSRGLRVGIRRMGWWCMGGLSIRGFGLGGKKGRGFVRCVFSGFSL
ncbi:conserved hypothetical protein [Aspergillus terreus NIH2624]|uniref:Methyltransferase domain-containing protein n=1 Tax=Aspergillus terreus (strain NIH 2624 / FGSC A1156) TaxID=341663 RepID=Q0CHD8_ASPTN|nr:uncharacterized protein ATEG_06904 [Aspergillus terreus NIH2624]EAU32288.1 conserved hypothetical protein [Aspergillus terreus NIH2624]